MKLAIMQPYIFPYIGYWQMVNAVDQIVIYDNIKYTKKGWINRNRFLQNGQDADFTLALQKDPDHLDIRERRISPVFNRMKLLNQIREAYRKAPYFEPAYRLFEKVILNEETNLFDYLLFSIKETCTALNIKTELIASSLVDADHSLKSQERVISICQSLGAGTYINPIGGKELYSAAAFKEKGIELKFIRSMPAEYKQLDHEFVPWLSIIDVMMFNGPKEVSQMLNNYTLE
jgi:hypothetical protein